MLLVEDEPAVVDSMLDAYGGDVWVEDNDPTGTVVAIELPAAAD